MSSVQGKVGSPLVIEAPQCPSIGIMAVCAITSQSALVHIIAPVARIAPLLSILERQALVAFLARHEGVKPQQWEARQLVIECHPSGPTRRVVARSAEFALLSSMHVVGRVTSVAVRGEFLLTRAAAMAARTRSLPMCAGQREARVAFMIEENSPPTFGVVAIAASCAEFPAVLIVDAMASDAASVDLHVACTLLPSRRIIKRPTARRCAVTALARSALMFAAQRELRLAGMIELSSPPVGRLVAVSAILPKAPPVGIIHQVTITTVRRRTLEFARRVAEPAIHAGVTTIEREVRARMVEASFAPARFGVALRAVLSQLTLMRIICGVAVSTIPRCVAVLPGRRMTACTRDAFVGSSQRGVGQIVIEGFGDESHDIGVSSKMLTVTTTACSERGCRLQPVESIGLVQVCRNFLVTNETETDFGLAVEGAVTALAVAFHVGMPLDYLAGGDQLLKIDRNATARGKQRDRAEQHRRLQISYSSQHSVTALYADQYMLTATT